MHLYEEYKDYETMWDDIDEIKETNLEEDLLGTTMALVHWNGPQILGILGSIIGLLVGFAVAPICGLATIALWIKSISLVIGVCSVLGLIINEDITDEAALEQSFAKVDIMQLAKTNPKIRKKIQRIYDEAEDPEKAAKVISRLESGLRKQSKPLAKVLKKVDIKGLEANEALISKKALDQAQKVATRDTTEEN